VHCSWYEESNNKPHLPSNLKVPAWTCWAKMVDMSTIKKLASAITLAAA